MKIRFTLCFTIDKRLKTYNVTAKGIKLILSIR